MCSRTKVPGQAAIPFPKSTGLVATVTQTVPNRPITSSRSAHGRWLQSSSRWRSVPIGSCHHPPHLDKSKIWLGLA